jgi:hypothetical protein
MRPDHKCVIFIINSGQHAYEECHRIGWDKARAMEIESKNREVITSIDRFTASGAPPAARHTMNDYA